MGMTRLDLRQLIDRGALLIYGKFRVANDVDEQDMGDFELDLFLALNGHLVVHSRIT